MKKYEQGDVVAAFDIVGGVGLTYENVRFVRQVVRVASIT